MQRVSAFEVIVGHILFPVLTSGLAVSLALASGVEQILVVAAPLIAVASLPIGGRLTAMARHAARPRRRRLGRLPASPGAPPPRSRRPVFIPAPVQAPVAWRIAGRGPPRSVRPV